MAKKRIILDVNEATHSRLKSEAAQLGVSLGSYCASILESGGEQSSSVAPVELTTAVLATMPLDTLRDMSVSLANSRPGGWERKVGSINSEIRRRYRV